MIRAWRLSKARYAGDLTGQGAARDGQRWNQPGQRAVYLGMTAEITVLEVLVHLNGVLSAPLVLCGYDVPETPGLIKEVDPTALPDGLNAIPHGQASAALGGGAPGSQPAAQPLASGHATGGAGAPGAFSARSTAALTHFPYSTTDPLHPCTSYSDVVARPGGRLGFSATATRARQGCSAFLAKWLLPYALCRCDLNKSSDTKSPHLLS